MKTTTTTTTPTTTTPTTTPTFRISAYLSTDKVNGVWTNLDKINHVSAALHVNTRADADAVAAMFPKSVRVRASVCSGRADNYTDWGVTAPEEIGTYSARWGYVSFQVLLSADDNNKGTNEAGRARLRRFLKTATVRYVMDATNSATRDQWNAFVAGL